MIKYRVKHPTGCDMFNLTDWVRVLVNYDLHI